MGCHPGTTRPLGTLARKELRGLRHAAHAAFDPLWQRKAALQQVSRSVARRAGYAWLASQLGVDRKACHIALFDEEQCRRVVDLCTPFLTGKVMRQ